MLKQNLALALFAIGLVVVMLATMAAFVLFFGGQRESIGLAIAILPCVFWSAAWSYWRLAVAASQLNSQYFLSVWSQARKILPAFISIRQLTVTPRR